MSIIADNAGAKPAAKRVVGKARGKRKPVVCVRPVAHVNAETDPVNAWRGDGAPPPLGHNEPPTSETLAEDLLIGAEAIAAELGISMRKAFYWLERSLIPARKTGRTWVASRRRLRQHFGAE